MLDIGLETLELPGVRVHARIGACSCPCGDAGFLECAETPAAAARLDAVFAALRTRDADAGHDKGLHNPLATST